MMQLLNASIRLHAKLRSRRVALASEQGFTLIELLIVIALIGMIGTFATIKIMDRFDQAKVKATKIQIKQLGNVLNAYKLDCSRYPTTDQGLDALIRKSEGGPQCRSYNPTGYLEGGRLPRDGWDRDFLYESTDGQNYVITSYGGDGEAGGEGINKDISSNDAD